MTRPDIAALLWLDFETTGLDLRQCRIIEAGWILTDLNGNELKPMCQMVFPLPAGGWEPEAMALHAASGLIGECAASEWNSTGAFERQMLGLLSNWQADRDGKRRPQIALAGSGVERFDRLLIKDHFPKMDALLPYWCIDVSSLRRMLELVDPSFVPDESKSAHRAASDVAASLAQYRHIRAHLGQAATLRLAGGC